MKDQCLDVGVFQKVVELVVEVAVVDVDRHAADFHCGEIGLGVLRRVVQIHADFRVLLQTRINQALRKVRRAVFILAPGYPPFPLNQRDMLRYRVGNGFPNQRKV